MIKILDCFARILTELRDLAQPGRAENMSFFPGLIWTGSEGSIWTNAEIEKQIRKVADWMLDQRPHLKGLHSLKEWRSRVRSSFGPAIVGIDLDEPVEHNVRLLKQLIEAAIDQAPASISKLQISMGCTLFTEPLTAAFQLGPVRFEPKAEWLHRAESAGQFDKITSRRMDRAFSGKRLAHRKNGVIAAQERNIISVLSNAQMVCTVTTEQLAGGLAETRSILAARLAQTAIALCWRVPSRTLEGFHISADHGPHLIETIPFIEGGRVIGGIRMKGIPTGPSMGLEDWASLQRDAAGYFAVAGKMIRCWTSAPAYDRSPPILRRLSQSLAAFWQGCRDENDLMAIVKFTASLEALVEKGKSTGIEKLIEARLGLTRDQKLTEDKTVGDVIKLIYSDGRSKTLHGSNEDIMHDWSDARLIAETLSRQCLVRSINFLDRNPDAKQLGDLLEEI